MPLRDVSLLALRSPAAQVYLADAPKPLERARTEHAFGVGMTVSNGSGRQIGRRCGWVLL
jgi:hypothetical protein